MNLQRRWVLSTSGFFLFIVGSPNGAWADNCSSLTDCWSTTGAAAAAAVGAAVTAGASWLFGHEDKQPNHQPQTSRLSSGDLEEIEGAPDWGPLDDKDGDLEEIEGAPVWAPLDDKD